MPTRTLARRASTVFLGGTPVVSQRWDNAVEAVSRETPQLDQMVVTKVRA
eukprot:COSAG06_NODE_60993_length_269_cov_0.605882_1_plen_49_part_10